MATCEDYMSYSAQTGAQLACSDGGVGSGGYGGSGGSLPPNASRSTNPNLQPQPSGDSLGKAIGIGVVGSAIWDGIKAGWNYLFGGGSSSGQSQTVDHGNDHLEWNRS